MKKEILEKISEMGENVLFNESNHAYWLQGTRIPSVTTVMKPLSNAQYKDVPEFVLNAAANKGTAVHKAIEEYIKYGIMEIDDAYEPYFKAFMKWFGDKVPEPISSEFKTYHDIMRYAGTIDFIGIVDGKLTIIDFKTTYKLIDKNCAVQLEAYSQALKRHGIVIEEKEILQLKKDGTYVEEKFAANDLVAWDVFVSLKNVHDYVQK